jgi:hypothetical protein
MSQQHIRIGGASAFWGDSPDAAAQLIEKGDVHAVVLDYLSEVTMSIMSRAKAKNPQAGFATDFTDIVMPAIARRVVESGIKIVTNAGGTNVAACRTALIKSAASIGVSLKIAVISGDDLIESTAEFRTAGIIDTDTGRPFPDKPWSVNAYLGAMPIAAALDAGADVVITGRCVDSALVLGILVHHFKWRAEDYDRMAAGSLVGHVLECGTQVTGGIFTDWEQVEGWEDMGFPVAECYADGSFVVTKPRDTGGLVSVGTVAEQIVYELGDPVSYVLPDVVCDFSQIRLQQQGANRVHVSGARGCAPTPTLKVCATYQDGFRCTAMYTMVGQSAAEKSRRSAEAILTRCRRQFVERQLADFRRVDLKLLGTELVYGPHARPEYQDAREVTLRLDVHHDSSAALNLFAREIAPAGTAMAPGRCSLVGGRPTPTPLVRLFSFLWPRDRVVAQIDLDGTSIVASASTPSGAPARPLVTAPSADVTSAAESTEPRQNVPLLQLAWARSGDKGDSANIGVIARRSEDYSLLCAHLSSEAVAAYFAHLVQGPVRRFLLPGFHALNFVLQHALDGGGTASLRNDPLAKTFAQMLLDIPVSVPDSWRPAKQRQT